MSCRTTFIVSVFLIPTLIMVSCTERKNQAQLENDIKALNLTTGDIALCGSGADQFGTVNFSFSCSEKIREDFNLATALLHSFEYSEAEKVFARIIDKDPECVMAYWGVAMSNFHPLWVPPNAKELKKGAKAIELGRSIVRDPSSKESHYLEAIATVYDQSDVLDYRTRVVKFEKASEKIFQKYAADREAAIFYALALDASADPADKTFTNQKKAGDILNKLFFSEPNHPGIAHYLIHNYDYPELAQSGLKVARKYASIAAASAHAQHMPSHIFMRLGLWEEAIQSNNNSVTSALCYAEKAGIKGHWDEELHGLDYLVYAYLQKGQDDKALEQFNYLKTINEVFPVNFKDAYAFAAIPARYAVERKDWTAASKLVLGPSTFPWEKFIWEKANIHFSRLLGFVNTRDITQARKEFEELRRIHQQLSQENEKYKANLVAIQVKASDAWLKMTEGKKDEAVQLMTEAAEMEEATAKHPVTPGEIIPARELLGDLYLQQGDPVKALTAYEQDLKLHPNKLNDVYGAGLSAEKSGDKHKAKTYYTQLLTLTNASANSRLYLSQARTSLESLNHQ
jgi:tetratricopeptide (TPR) repeat protein